jgi:uncharacterized membrane protein YkoI
MSYLEDMNNNSPIEGILNMLEEAAGPRVTAATHRKIERAKAAFRRFEAQADAEAALEAQKQDYVVTLEHPEHGTVKIARRTLTAAEAKAAAMALAPGFKHVATELERTAR